MIYSTLISANNIICGGRITEAPQEDVFNAIKTYVIIDKKLINIFLGHILLCLPDYNSNY